MDRAMRNYNLLDARSAARAVTLLGSLASLAACGKNAEPTTLTIKTSSAFILAAPPPTDVGLGVLNDGDRVKGLCYTDRAPSEGELAANDSVKIPNTDETDTRNKYGFVTVLRRRGPANFEDTFTMSPEELKSELPAC
jgi:hypothetical protein